MRRKNNYKKRDFMVASKRIISSVELQNGDVKMKQDLNFVIFFYHFTASKAIMTIRRQGLFSVKDNQKTLLNKRRISQEDRRWKLTLHLNV